MASIQPINFREALEGIEEYWWPRVVGRVNDQYVKVAKLKGELAWHKHDNEDELFHVLRGQLVIHFEDHDALLREGDFCVVPKGVMHNPVAEQECWIVLIETVTTQHTGETQTPRTRTIEEQMRGPRPLP